MEVEGEEVTTKRRLSPESDEETGEEKELLNFFEHFKVPANLWGVFLRVQVSQLPGLLYLHRHTNKPLIIVARHENDKIVGYNIHFQTLEEKAQHKVLLDMTNLDVMGYTPEDYQLSMLHRLDLIGARYTLEGCLTKEEDALRYCDDFLADMNLKRAENLDNKGVKRKK